MIETWLTIINSIKSEASRINVGSHQWQVHHYQAQNIDLAVETSTQRLTIHETCSARLYSLASPNLARPSIRNGQEPSVKLPFLARIDHLNIVVSQYSGEDFGELELSQVAPGALIVSDSPLKT